jgi:hypothetical protein
LENTHEANMTRNSCKLILILVACAVPLVAAIVNAEQTNQPIDQSGAIINRATQAAATPHNINGQGVEEGPGQESRSPDTGEHAWIIVLGVAGLATSLVAGAYAVWSRSRQVQGPVTVLMPRAADKTIPVPAERETRPERRAA